MIYTCKDCERAFDNPGALGGHRNWCKQNPNINEKTRQRHLKRLQLASSKATTKPRIELTLTCKCGTNFTQFLKQEEIDKGKYVKHCSRSCANARVHTAESKEKIAESLRQYSQTQPAKKRREQRKKKSRRLIDWQCKNCNLQQRVPKNRASRKTCNKECARQLSSKRMTQRIINRTNRQFSTRCTYTFKGTSIRCDSKIEYACLNFFEQNHTVLSIKRCAASIPYSDHEAKLRHYVPDFIVETSNEIFVIECKSSAIGKSLNKKWHNYRKNIPYKQKALIDYATANNMAPLWFTPRLHQKYYKSLFGKDLSQ